MTEKLIVVLVEVFSVTLALVEAVMFSEDVAAPAVIVMLADTLVAIVELVGILKF
jgi:hypothetical protein